MLERHGAHAEGGLTARRGIELGAVEQVQQGFVQLVGTTEHHFDEKRRWTATSWRRRKASIYTTARDLDQLREAGDRNPLAPVEAHVRRLEAPRRVRAVEHLADSTWKTPVDLMQKAQQHDSRKTEGQVIELRSHLPFQLQVHAIRTTWLDRNLVVDSGVANQGFGAQVRDEVRSRVDFLAEQGMTGRRASAWPSFATSW